MFHESELKNKDNDQDKCFLLLLIHLDHCDRNSCNLQTIHNLLAFLVKILKPQDFTQQVEKSLP